MLDFKPITKTIKLPIYPINVHIVIGDKDHAIKTLKKYKSLSQDLLGVNFTSAEAFTISISGHPGNILLIFHPDSYHKTEVLVHELIHISMWIFQHIGCDLNEYTEEPFAYLNDYLFTEIRNIINESYST